jgi:hypothetical protein
MRMEISLTERSIHMRMRRTALPLTAAVAAVMIVAALGVAAPAIAATGPSLTCNIQPSGNDNFSPRCTTTYARNVYTLDYLAQGGTGTYTYSWTYPTPSTVLAGCTSTSGDCEISVHQGTGDSSFVATVVLTQNGTNTTLTSTAFIPGVCYPQFC